MKQKSQIASFLREVSIVVIGVLIALFINNWNEKVKHDKFINKTLFAIGKEIKSSKRDVEKTLDKHILVADSIMASTNYETKSIRQTFIRLGGLQIPEIKNIGLRFFIANNADLVEYEIISDLSEIEFSSKGFELKMNKLLDLSYELMDSKNKEDKIKIAQILSEVIENEEYLLELYNDFLSKYKVSLQQNEKQQ